jgi:hypothetical protein
MALFGRIGAWNYSAETARSAVSRSPRGRSESFNSGSLTRCHAAGGCRIARSARSGSQGWRVRLLRLTCRAADQPAQPEMTQSGRADPSGARLPGIPRVTKRALNRTSPRAPRPRVEPLVRRVFPVAWASSMIAPAGDECDRLYPNFGPLARFDRTAAVLHPNFIAMCLNETEDALDSSRSGGRRLRSLPSWCLVLSWNPDVRAGPTRRGRDGGHASRRQTYGTKRSRNFHGVR